MVIKLKMRTSHHLIKIVRVGIPPKLELIILSSSYIWLDACYEKSIEIGIYEVSEKIIGSYAGVVPICANRMI